MLQGADEEIEFTIETPKELETFNIQDRFTENEERWTDGLNRMPAAGCPWKFSNTNLSGEEVQEDGGVLVPWTYILRTGTGDSLMEEKGRSIDNVNADIELGSILSGNFKKCYK